MLTRAGSQRPIEGPGQFRRIVSEKEFDSAKLAQQTIEKHARLLLRMDDETTYSEAQQAALQAQIAAIEAILKKYGAVPLEHPRAFYRWGKEEYETAFVLHTNAQEPLFDASVNGPPEGRPPLVRVLVCI